MLFKKLYRASQWIGVGTLMAACSNPPPADPPTTTAHTPPKAQPAPRPPTAPSTVIPDPRTSNATSPREYRRDGATHLYALNAKRIFPGKMPPLLHAIGVLQVDINASGNVTALRWMRAPKHAPDVIAEIERSVRAASPFPAPVKLGKVTYTDTWLWDKSGRFQLDTLTEGQL